MLSLSDNPAFTEHIGHRSAEVAAKVGVAVSAGSASIPWIADVSGIMTVISTFVAVVAGSATAWYYVDKTLAARRARKNLAEAIKEADLSAYDLAHLLMNRKAQAEDDQNDG